MSSILESASRHGKCSEKPKGRRPLLRRACQTMLLLVVAIAGSLAEVVATATRASASPGLVVADLNHGVSAQDLANALAGAGVTVSGVTYTGANNSAGSFTGGTGILGFDAGIVLGSGSVQTATEPHEACAKGVEGPNECDSNTTQFFTAGDADLEMLSGFPTHDAAILEFDFVPQFPTVQFRYVFASDEYNEFVNTQFNDVFGFFVNNQNCATVGNPPQPVSINTINGGNPFGTNATNPTLYRNNDPDDPGPPTIDTEMDGVTTVLECNANVNPGVVNHMKLAIADASDSRLDSNVFLEEGSLVSGTQITTTLSGGGQSGATITVPPGTSVTDSATLSGANAATAGGTVTYTVFSDAQCSTVLENAGSKTVTNGTVPDSNPVTFNQPGTFYWQAMYSGDTRNNGSTTECGKETVTVTVEPPTTLNLTPENATNVVAQQHCLTATVTNATGGPTGNISVLFTVSGANSTSGSMATDANGKSSFCYVGINPGNDTIDAFADTDGNGTKDPAEPSDTASKTWESAAATNCEVEGEGRLSTNRRATFDFEVEVDADTGLPEGRVVFRDRAAGKRFISTEILSLTISGTSATIEGKGTIDGVPTDFVLEVADLGGSRLDTFKIELTSGYTAAGNTRGDGIEIECEEDDADDGEDGDD